MLVVLLSSGTEITEHAIVMILNGLGMLCALGSDKRPCFVGGKTIRHYEGSLVEVLAPRRMDGNQHPRKLRAGVALAVVRLHVRANYKF
jgi:hypothetical protein